MLGVYMGMVSIMAGYSLAITEGGTESYLYQIGGVSAAIVTGFWLIRRYDDRADKAAEIAQHLLDAERERTMDLLKQERADHAETRRQLWELMKEKH